MPEYARLDLTAIIKYLNSAVQKISQTDYGVIMTLLDSSQAHLAPVLRHPGCVENFAGDEVMCCVLAPGEETSFGPQVSGDLSQHKTFSTQKINMTHCVWDLPSSQTLV